MWIEEWLRVLQIHRKKKALNMSSWSWAEQMGRRLVVKTWMLREVSM
jgi:hypothetical protein